MIKTDGPGSALLVTKYLGSLVTDGKLVIEGTCKPQPRAQLRHDSNFPPPRALGRDTPTPSCSCFCRPGRDTYATLQAIEGNVVP
jgi:hypothetical protein